VKQSTHHDRQASRFVRGWLRAPRLLYHVVALIFLFFREMGRSNLSLLASALAFYGLLTVFPALVVVITTFTLTLNPDYIGWMMSGIQGIMPTEALGLISTELKSLSNSPVPQVGLGLVLSLLVSLWSAHSAATSIIDALNHIYRTSEQRSLVVYHVTALIFTVGGLLFGLAALAVVALIPAVLGFLPVHGEIARILAYARWPVLGGFMMVALVVLYRFAPCRRHPHWTRVLIGAGAATLLWLIGSGLFSYYVARFNSYDRTYGSIGAVIVLLMWFYVGAYAALMGALLDADMERRIEQQRR
jgi:membrane protein